MAAITSAQSGNWSATSTWVGGVKPAAGDAAVIATGHTVTVDENTAVGSKASEIGVGIRIQATNSTTYGQIIVNPGVVLSVAGYDRSTNTAIQIDQYAKLNNSGTILIDAPSDWGTIIVCNGHISGSSTAVFDIPSANLKWDNASTAVWLDVKAFDTPSGVANGGIYVSKLKSGTVKHPGPISNSAGNGIGSLGNSSFAILSGSGLVREVATYASMTTNGDYFIDYGKGVIFFKLASSASLSINCSFKYGTWFSSGILATNNAAGSSLVFNGSTFNYWGYGGTASDSEYVLGPILATYKYAETLNADRAFSVTGCTFNFCGRLMLYYPYGDASHLIQITGNTFNNNTAKASYDGNEAMFNIGYGGYVSISENTFNTAVNLFAPQRGPNPGMVVSDNTGTVSQFKLPYTMQGAAVKCEVKRNDITGYNDMLGDTKTFEEGGVSGQSYEYWDNKLTALCRGPKIRNYMSFKGNTLSRCYSDGIVFRQGADYLHDITIENNIVNDAVTYAAPGPDTGGGLSFGLVNPQWYDNVIVRNNTFNDGTSGIRFSYQEGNPALITRTQVYNNNITGNLCGVYRPAETGNAIIKMALSRLDYNNDYGNTARTGDIKQATFLQSGNEYNLSTRNVAGAYLHSPLYTLPDATSRSLVQANSGTAGSDKSITYSWGGGTSINMVKSQGTATAGTTASLTDSGKAWTDNAYLSMYVVIVSGTGAGQSAMITSNTATQLNILSNNDALTWVAPSTDSVYLIVNSETSLKDSGGTLGINVGLYMPDMVLTNGTYTDVGITITTNAIFVDPSYKSIVDLTPTNTILTSSGFGGTYIGAVMPAILNTITKSLGRLFGTFGGSRGRLL